MHRVEQCKAMHNYYLPEMNMSEIIFHLSWPIIHLQDKDSQSKKTLTTSLCVLVVDFVTGSKMSGFPFNNSSKASWSCCLLVSLAPATISSRVGMFVAATWLDHLIVWTIHHLGLRYKHVKSIQSAKNGTVWKHLTNSWTRSISFSNTFWKYWLLWKMDQAKSMKHTF